MIATGPITQIGWVTDDLEATERLLTEQFGTGAWTRIPDVTFGADTTTLRGEPVEFTAHISLGYAGDLQLELIQPVERSRPSTRSSSSGTVRGCTTSASTVDDVDAACAAAEAAGVPVLMRGSMMDGEIEFAYVDGSAAGAPYVELARIGPQMREFYAAVKAQSQARPMSADRVAVVTGVGAGSLGEAIAPALRELGFRVLTSTRTCATTADTHAMELTSRDVGRGVRAVGAARAPTGSTCWSTTPASTSTCARPGTSRTSSTACEVHWRTNYLGTAQLTRLLIPLLLATAEAHGEARVVNVVSKLHARGRNDGLDGHLTPYDSWTAYGTSKLALVHEAREIERRYGDRGLHGYSVHPGSVHTKIADRGLETAPLLGPAPQAGRARWSGAPSRRPTDGARTTVFCATSAQARAGWLPPAVGAEHPVGGRPGRGSRPDPVGQHVPLGATDG